MMRSTISRFVTYALSPAFSKRLNKFSTVVWSLRSKVRASMLGQYPHCERLNVGIVRTDLFELDSSSDAWPIGRCFQPLCVVKGPALERIGSERRNQRACC